MPAYYRKFKWYDIGYPSSGIQPIVIGDDQGGSKVSADPPGQDRQVEELRFFQQKYALPVHRGNRVNWIKWRTEYIFPDPNTARLFARTHNDSLPTMGTLVDAGQGFTPLYLTPATLKATVVNSESLGLTVIVEYTVRGGGAWSATPPPGVNPS